MGSSRDREISMSVGLGRSQLDSRGGVVGGTIDVNTLEMVGKLECFLILVYALNNSPVKLKQFSFFVNLAAYYKFAFLFVSSHYEKRFELKE